MFDLELQVGGKVFPTRLLVGMVVHIYNAFFLDGACWQATSSDSRKMQVLLKKPINVFPKMINYPLIKNLFAKGLVIKNSVQLVNSTNCAQSQYADFVCKWYEFTSTTDKNIKYGAMVTPESKTVPLYLVFLWKQPSWDVSLTIWQEIKQKEKRCCWNKGKAMDFLNSKQLCLLTHTISAELINFNCWLLLCTVFVGIWGITDQWVTTGTTRWEIDLVKHI